MRLIFICDNCKQWNELDFIRDKKGNSIYSKNEVKNMGLIIDAEMETTFNCTDNEADITIKDIDDLDDYFECESEISSIDFKCAHCGDYLIINF